MLSFKEIQLLPEIFLGIPLIILYVLNMESNSSFNKKAISAFRKVRPVWRFAILHIPEDLSNYYNESCNNVNAPFSDSAVVGKIVTVHQSGFLTTTRPMYIEAPILPRESINWNRERKVRYVQELAYVPRDPKIQVMVTSLPHQLNFSNNCFNCLVTKNTTLLSGVVFSFTKWGSIFKY